MQRFLVSFSNVSPKGFALGAYDFRSNELGWVPVPEVPSPITGADGLCTAEGGLLVSLQHPNGRSGLAFLDQALELRHYCLLQRARDVHGVAYDGQGVLFTDTGRNRVGWVPFSRVQGFGPEQEVWRCCPEEVDRVHMNSIAIAGKSVYVSMFGSPGASGWSTANQGQVVEITSGETICRGLFHPHSVRCIDGDIYCLESRRGRIHCFPRHGEPRVVAEVKGYLRGFWHDRQHFVVGVSAHRRRSKSTGVMNTPPTSDLALATARVCRIDRRTGQTASRAVTPYGAEMFDIVQAWPRVRSLDLSGVAAVSARFARLEDEARDALDVVPLYEGALHALVEDHQFCVARKVLERLVAKRPDHATWNYLLAFCLQSEGSNPMGALAHYDRALAHGFSEFWVRYNRGSLLMVLERNEEALLDIERALVLDPGHADTRELRRRLIAHTSAAGST